MTNSMTVTAYEYSSIREKIAEASHLRLFTVSNDSRDIILLFFVLLIRSIMDNQSNRTSSIKSNGSSVVHTPSTSSRDKHRESKLQHFVGVNLEQRIQTLRLRMLGHSSHDEDNPPPAIVPIKPMPYVRRFTVSVSLKKPRLIRFFLFLSLFLGLKIFLFNFSQRNSNAKQWSIGKKQFNENPKEVYKNFIFHI